MELSLTEIADSEGTDKGTVGPDARRGHNYSDIYDSYLSKMRNKSVTLLEIGLGVTGPAWNCDFFISDRNARGGASLRMWYRYFSQARIFGIDVNDASFLENERVTTGVADQGSPEQLRSLLHEWGVEEFDIIIDDGSHRPDHQQIAMSTLFPLLASGGVYFIEDLLDNGRGDRRFDRHSSGDVLNTRRVLREFARTGTFPKPNALGNPALLAASIENVSFYCPELTTERMSLWSRQDRARAAANVLLKKPIEVAVEYMNPRKESLCALHKS